MFVCKVGGVAYVGVSHFEPLEMSDSSGENGTAIEMAARIKNGREKLEK